MVFFGHVLCLLLENLTVEKWQEVNEEIGNDMQQGTFIRRLAAHGYNKTKTPWLNKKRNLFYAFMASFMCKKICPTGNENLNF